MAPFDAALLAAVIMLATPLLLTAGGELISQRAGVMNIGLEGMMLMGAFFGFYGVYKTGSIWIGVLAGVAVGALLAAGMVVLSVVLRADQIVVGVGLNLVAVGVTIFLNRVLVMQGSQATVHRMGTVAIPGLANIPWVGKALFDQTPIVYLAYVLFPIVSYFLYRTRSGLAVRAAGELPEAVETAGILVGRVRGGAVLTAGALAGLAGAFLSVAQVGLFVEGMTAGRGFLALAAVVFGRWRPRETVFACLLFGGADALQLRLQGSGGIPSSVWVVITVVILALAVLQARRRRGHRMFRVAVLVALAVACLTPVFNDWRVSLPPQLWLAMPYLLSIAALAGLVGHARVPSALAEPFARRNL